MLWALQWGKRIHSIFPWYSGFQASHSWIFFCDLAVPRTEKPASTKYRATSVPTKPVTPLTSTRPLDILISTNVKEMIGMEKSCFWEWMVFPVSAQLSFILSINIFAENSRKSTRLGECAMSQSRLMTGLENGSGRSDAYAIYYHHPYRFREDYRSSGRWRQ